MDDRGVSQEFLQTDRLCIYLLTRTQSLLHCCLKKSILQDKLYSKILEALPGSKIKLEYIERGWKTDFIWSKTWRLRDHQKKQEECYLPDCVIKKNHTKTNQTKPQNSILLRFLGNRYSKTPHTSALCLKTLSLNKHITVTWKKIHLGFGQLKWRLSRRDLLTLTMT